MARSPTPRVSASASTHGHLRDRVKRIAGELDLQGNDELHLAEIIKRAEDTLCIHNSNGSHDLSFCLRVAKLEVQLGFS